MEKKEVYQEKAEAKIRQWNAEIEKLKAKMDLQKAEAKETYREQIGKLESRKKEAEAKLSALKQKGDAAWMDLKDGVDRAINELQDSFDKVVSRFKQ